MYTLIERPDAAISETLITVAFLIAAAVLGFYRGFGHADLRVFKSAERSKNAEYHN